MEKKIIPFFRRHYGFILVCLLALFAVLPLTRPGFWPMHDDEQVGRLYELDLAVKSGHIPPRIAQDLGFGYGYPLFNFYPSFVYYIAELFVLAGFSYITSIELMIAVGFILTAIAMYIFAKEYLGEVGGVIAAVAYTYAPYHAVDVYVRGALPEFWSFAFVPALFWSYKKLSEYGSIRYLISSSLFIAFLILTHNLVALMSAFYIGLFVIYVWWESKDKKRFMLQVLLSGILGLMLSAFFWIPSYVEKQYTMIELLTKELADYRLHFVYLRQLWNSPWGYGGSLYGLMDGLSFQIGKLHIIFSLLAGVSAFLLLRSQKKTSITMLFFSFFLLSVFFISFYSSFLWDSIPSLSYIQFPWRFLLFASFSASFLLGTIVLLPLSRRVQFLLSAVMIALLIIMNVSYFQPSRYLGNVTDQNYISQDTLRWRTSVMAFEYVPRGVATKTSNVGTTVIDIHENEVASSTAEVVSGKMTVTTLTDKPQEKELKVSVAQPGLLRMNTYAFPGWKVYDNGQEIHYTDRNKLKLITISLPQGMHTVRGVFTDTPIRQISNLLSLLGVILMIGLVGRDTYIKRMRAKNRSKR